MEIGNHSWDHVHHAPDRIAIAAGARDNFELVDNYADADAEIRQASAYIDRRLSGWLGLASRFLPRRCRLFAFPFGHVNEYLVRDYLPSRASEHGMVAAFGCGGTKVTRNDPVWNIPRVVCGEHWRSPAELEALLGRQGS